MKKKSTFKMLIGLALLPFVLSGCSLVPQNSDNNEEQKTDVDDRDPEIVKIYEKYLANGGTLSYEEWLKSIKGEKGDQGEPGKDGKDGVDGKDGYSVLTGQGQPSVAVGKNGDSYIDLSTWDYYVKENGYWVKKGNIKGQDGSGSSSTSGESAYQIYIRLHPDYKGTEEEWMEDLVNGRLIYYTVTFDYGFDNLVREVKVRCSTSVSEPEEVEREGYTFKGWYNGNTLYDFNAKVYGDLTLTAKYKNDSEDENVNLQFWVGTGTAINNLLIQMIDEFKVDNPNITVNLVNNGGYSNLNSRIISGFPSGDYPDLTFTYNDNIVEYLNYGKVVKLDDLINNEDYGWSQEDKNDIYQPFLAESMNYPIEGTYSLPFLKTTETMFYNASVLIGLDLSSIDDSINGGLPLTEEYINDLTWEDLFDHLIPAINVYNASLSDSNKIIQTGSGSSSVFTYDSDSNFFITLAKQYGYGYTSVNPVTGTGSIDFNNANMKNLMKKLYAVRQANQYSISTLRLSNSYASNALVQGQTLFAVGSTSGASYYSSDKYELKIANIPHPEGKSTANILQGTSMVIFNKGSEARQIAAWKLYKYITNQTNSAKLALQSGYMPVRKSAYQTTEMQEYLNSDIGDPGYVTSGTVIKQRVMRELSTLGNTAFTPALFRGSSKARDEVDNLLPSCLNSSDLDANIDSLFLTAENNIKMVM